MKLVLAALVIVAASMVGCGDDVEPRRPQEVRLRDLLERPEAFDGRAVVLRARVVRADDLTLLTSGFAESYPPQPVEPTVYVRSPLPDDACIARDEGVAWGRVRAEGVFRYDEGGAFGPLGVFPMALEEARILCP